MSSISQTTDKNNNAAPSKPLNISHQNKFKYKRKWYYRDEWAMKCKNDKLFNNYILGTTVPLTNLNKSKSVNDLCHKDNKNKETTTTTTNSIIIPEPSIPLLLLNYFIIYGYEEAAIRMCKELNLINNNNDIKQFNELFMIKERNKIKILIISGKITDAINLIDELFGLNILYEDTINNNNMVDENNNNNYSYSSSSSSSAGGGGGNDDLYFQLILLNLIEMIRNNSYSNDIPKLVQYARTHLSTKASQSKKHMTDLQSVISLLMLTAASNNNNNNNNKEYVPLNINKLPSNLKMLYSIKLRNRLAHSINMKFLQIINIKVSNQNKFPNLILSGNLSLNSTDPINKIAHFQLHNHHDRHDDQLTNTAVEIPVKMDLNPDQLPVTDHNRYWQETKKYLNLQNNTCASNSDNNIGWENFPFEAKLVQLMKLWIYSENRLHRKGFGIPRVEDNLKSS